MPAWMTAEGSARTEDHYWGVAGRVHYTLVALAGLVVVWLLYYWNLLNDLWF